MAGDLYTGNEFLKRFAESSMVGLGGISRNSFSRRGDWGWSEETESTKAGGMTMLDEGILSWVFFRVLQSLYQSPPDVEAAKGFASDGVKYLIHREIPERYAA
jgi:hypothetical protein